MICCKPYWRAIPGSRGKPVPLPCGQCVTCKINKSREWSFRMVAESGYWNESAFLTLTYESDDVLNLHKPDLQNAFKRARKGGLRFKYYACGEYGGEYGRPHYHVAIFYSGDLGFVPDISYGKNNGHLSWWPHGICNLGTFTKESARYTSDYLLKELGSPTPGWRVPPFRLVSLGLAKSYLLEHRYSIENQGIRFGTSFIGTPRYYRKFMATFLDEAGVPVRNSKYIASLKGARFVEMGCFRGHQRMSNVVVRQKLISRS